jgi:hypothetical protein
MAILSGISDVRAEQEQCNLKAAILLKNGWRTPSTEPAPIIVTAGDCGVFIATAIDMRYGIKFTVEEWNQIVEFVDNQLLDEAEAKADESWKPDWSKINPEYNYVAADSDGRVHAYFTKPEIYDHEWCIGEDGGDFIHVRHESLPEGINWKQTLYTRPGV